MKSIRYILVFVFFIFIVQNLHAQYVARSCEVIDTPTAYTINRGTYQFSFLGYDNGGLEVRSFIGLHDNLFLGMSFDMQNAIGKDEVQPNVPGVLAKIKFTDGWETFPISIALGYGSFYIGNESKTENYDNELNRMIYGPYFVVTKPVFLLGNEQHISGGIRVPAQPYYVPEDSSYFISFDFPLSDSVIFKTEGERIYYNFSNPRKWIWNVGLKYSYMNHIGIEFFVMFQKQDRANRMLRIEYIDQF